MTTPLLMTVPEAAELLRCSPRTIHRRVKDGTIPHRLVAGRILMRRRDLLRIDERPRGAYQPTPAPREGTVARIAWEINQARPDRRSA